jgi:hypothetical protein
MYSSPFMKIQYKTITLPAVLYECETCTQLMQERGTDEIIWT